MSQSKKNAEHSVEPEVMQAPIKNPIVVTTMGGKQGHQVTYYVDPQDLHHITIHLDDGFVMGMVNKEGAMYGVPARKTKLVRQDDGSYVRVEDDDPA